MTDITVHIASNDWCVHFVVTATQIPVGPWLLFDSNDEIKAKVFTWGHVTEEDMTQYEIDLRRWGTDSVPMQLTDSQLSVHFKNSIRATTAGFSCNVECRTMPHKVLQTLLSLPSTLFCSA